jgi:hypothetical protein
MFISVYVLPICTAYLSTRMPCLCLSIRICSSWYELRTFGRGVGLNVDLFAGAPDAYRALVGCPLLIYCLSVLCAANLVCRICMSCVPYLGRQIKCGSPRGGSRHVQSAGGRCSLIVILCSQYVCCPVVELRTFDRGVGPYVALLAGAPDAYRALVGCSNVHIYLSVLHICLQSCRAFGLSVLSVFAPPGMSCVPSTGAAD